MIDGARFIKKCPNCHNLIGFSSNQKTIRCHCCNKEYSFEQLSIQPDSFDDEYEHFSKNITSAESALAFLETFFDSYDWEEYCYSNPFFLIKNISPIVERVKVSFSNSPTTWILEFKNITFPLKKRLAFMQGRLEEIEKLDLESDLNQIEEIYDYYYLNSSIIFEYKDYVLATLQNDIDLMRKYGLDPVRVSLFNKEFELIKLEISKLKETNDIYDLDVIKSKADRIQLAHIKDYISKGINIQSTYLDGIKYYLSNKRNEAMLCFKKIEGYKDSHKFINKLQKTSSSFTISGCKKRIKSFT